MDPWDPRRAMEPYPRQLDVPFYPMLNSLVGMYHWAAEHEQPKAEPSDPKWWKCESCMATYKAVVDEVPRGDVSTLEELGEQAHKAADHDKPSIIGAGIPNWRDCGVCPAQCRAISDEIRAR